MLKHNSIRTIQYLLYLILFITSGCAEKATTTSLVYEMPSHIEPIQASAPVHNPNKFYHSIKSRSKAPSYNSLWQRLIDLYALPKIENSRIDKEIQRYLAHPEYLTKIQKRAEPYLYYIVEQVEAKQIPGEFALLPVVESAFKPNAVSRSKASGLWQFMPATGRLFGLKQNWWYDGRNDIYTSTQAATSYLKQLSQGFDGDWFLALASYNAGKGNIRKAIRKNREKNLATDYWSLSLRQETMNYVPRLIAIATIFANAEKYNIALQHIPNQPYFSVVNLDSQVDISIAMEMAQMPLQDFLILNPGHKQTNTDPDGPYHLLIHADKTDNFKEKLAHTNKKDRLKWRRHHIKTGENLGMIAKQYGTSVNALRQSNRLKNNNIRAGNLLLIPASIKTLAKTKRQFYTVKKGDTFWDIARQFSVRSKDIANWNNLSLNKALQPGQKLIIEEG